MIRQLPDDAVVLVAPSTATSRYTEPRPGKLSAAQIDSIVSAVARGRPLRDVAADFGVSAERVRQLARERGATPLAAAWGLVHPEGQIKSRPASSFGWTRILGAGQLARERTRRFLSCPLPLF